METVDLTFTWYDEAKINSFSNVNEKNAFIRKFDGDAKVTLEKNEAALSRVYIIGKSSTSMVSSLTMRCDIFAIRFAMAFRELARSLVDLLVILIRTIGMYFLVIIIDDKTCVIIK